MSTVLELIALETLPVGASRYPEWGSAAVVGGALFANVGGQGAGRAPHPALLDRHVALTDPRLSHEEPPSLAAWLPSSGMAAGWKYRSS